MSDLKLDVDQASELKAAFRRTRGSDGEEWTNAHIKELSEGDHLGLVLDYLHGRAKIVPVELSGEEKINSNKFLKLISGDEALVLDALDGTRTIAESSSVFKAGIDSDFKNWGLNKKGKSTVEMPVDVHEITEDGMFTQIFGSMLGAYLKDGVDAGERKRFIEEHCEDLRKLCMKSDDQIINFCEKFPEKLRKDGYGTFFLREDEDTGNFFVARVRFYSGGSLDVRVREFADDDVWLAEVRHRFVVPQLAKA